MVRRVDVDGSRQSRDDGSASLESFGVSLEGIIERELARGKGLRGSPVVDVVRGEVCDAAVAMLGVIPRGRRFCRKPGRRPEWRSGRGSSGGTSGS